MHMLAVCCSRILRDKQFNFMGTVTRDAMLKGLPGGHHCMNYSQ